MTERVTPMPKQGDLKGVSVSNFLQLIEMEKKTCILEVISPNKKRGLLYFYDGVLYDAVCEKLKAEKAALEMIRWENTDLKFVNLSKQPIKRRIKTSLMGLIMEAMQLKDEQEERDGVEGPGDGPEKAPDKEANIPKPRSSNDVEAGQADSSAGALIIDDKRVDKRSSAKEAGMDVGKLKQTIDTFAGDLGNALIATDIYGTHDGQSIIGYNSQPKGCALFAQLTQYMVDSLKESGFPSLGRYYILDLVDGNTVIVIPLGEWQWGMLVNTKKAQLGLILNVIIPKIINVFEEALTG